MKTITLAHYYCTPDVQALADRVGDSLDLSRFAAEQEADRIVFAGVRFMAETAKILNPQAEVILPDSGSTCSLVTQVDGLQTSVKITTPYLYSDIHLKRTVRPTTTVITYINSSVELKALSDIIVTSANVEDIVTKTIEDGGYVFFTPDRNMGAYLKSQHPEWGDQFEYYEHAVCEVHDQFKSEEIEKLMSEPTAYGNYLLAHPESPLPVLEQATFVGSTRGMLEWVKNYKNEYGRIFVATEEGLLYNMRELRPKLDIQLAPTYTGCQCNACPYMKLNTVENVQQAINFGIGTKIEIDDDLIDRARKSIDRMLEF